MSGSLGNQLMCDISQVATSVVLCIIFRVVVVDATPHISSSGVSTGC